MRRRKNAMKMKTLNLALIAAGVLAVGAAGAFSLNPDWLDRAKAQMLPARAQAAPFAGDVQVAVPTPSAAPDAVPMIAGHGQGPDYRAIVQHWTQILRPGGWLMFEVGEDQADAVMALMKDAKYTDVTALEDTAGIRRVVVGRI